MKKDYGEELIKILKLQRTTFIRTADNKKMITNHLLYNQLEEESERIQRLIGLENKRFLAKKLHCNIKDLPKKIYEKRKAYRKINY